MNKSIFTILLICFFCTSIAIAGDIKLLEASAISGDKIEGRSEQGIYYFDLFGIDAPEEGQPFGEDSTKCLQAAIDNGLPLRVFVAEACPSGVPCAARVFNRYGWSLSDWQVEKGMAWAIGNADNFLPIKQQDAKRKAVGLWSAADPIPPWGWRNKEEHYELKREAATQKARIKARTAGKTYTIRDSRAEQAAWDKMSKKEKQAANDAINPPSEAELLRREIAELKKEVKKNTNSNRGGGTAINPHTGEVFIIH